MYHKRLTFAFSSASDKWSPSQQRQLAFVSEFTTNVCHVRGADNDFVVADALSRVSLENNEPDEIAAMDGAMTSVINHAAMAVQQDADAGIQRVVSDPNCSLQLARCALPDTTERVLVDMPTGRPRPLVPAMLTRTILFDPNHKLITLERGRCDV